MTLDSLGEERRLPIELEVISLVEVVDKPEWVEEAICLKTARLD